MGETVVGGEKKMNWINLWSFTHPGSHIGQGSVIQVGWIHRLSNRQSVCLSSVSVYFLSRVSL